MAEFPALPLWTDAYLGDTTHLTTIEHGAYLLLLMVAWRNGGWLPNDDKLLARYARLNMAQWGRIRHTIMAFFIVENDRVIQRRLRDELNVIKQVRDKRREAAGSKWRKYKERHDANAMHLESKCNAPTPTPTPTPIDSDTDVSELSARKRAAPVNRPDDVTPELWDDFRSLRKLKKSPLTQTALAGIKREADKAGWSLSAVLAECCERGWQSFKADWIKGNRNGSGNHDPRDGFERAIDRALERD